jgi:hypothetical protein
MSTNYKFENYKINADDNEVGRCGVCGEPMYARNLRKYEKYPEMCLPCFLSELTNAPSYIIDEVSAMIYEDMPA